MKTPAEGFVRLAFVSGRVTKWQPVADVDADSDPHWVNCAGDEAGVAAVRFARLYMASIEYATAEEVKALAEAEAKAKKEVAAKVVADAHA